MEKIENISVSESAPLGAELPITVAEDFDIGNNSVQSYEIVSRDDRGIFDLKVSRPTSEITKVKLVVSKRLDREINDSFHLVIEASDGGSPPKFGRKSLNVKVLDSNDHIPKFSKEVYVGEVRENSRAGTFVLNVTATDEDIGTNAEILFSLQVRPQYQDLFTLDARTGELRTNAVLDYELFKDYQLEVTAKDNGPDSIPSTTVVKVKVLDENDNKPEITVTALPDAYDKQGKIPEDTSLNAGVALITVRDKDSGDNGRVTVTLQHHKQDFGLQEMFAGQYILEIRQPLSLDRHAQYKIKIVAEDHGLPLSQKNSHVLVVKLADSNRHAPTFAQKVYSVDVSDDVTPGAVVARMTATDEDDGRNSELIYSLESMRIGARNGSDDDLRKWFGIDPKTGYVGVHSKLWCAFTPSFLLNIDVRDKGRVPFHGKTALKIAIQCSRHVYNFSVAENKPVGVEVGRVPLTSIAPDKPLRIRLVSNTDDFTMDEKSGILTATKRLDREVNDSYSLTAVISDGSVNMTIILNVKVEDINDNAPVFIGFEGSYNMTLSNAVLLEKLY
ncbi:Protocadherin-10 [Desmophyllum pertusum]|uniref:Protocadherin-10 n=1 Tax=Desmophyllum pertusum TaxID=174260 RepID=A0A9W9Y9P9_9CNID|nr:Protocadherin-10 [Desmophyllum pertusum]